VEEQEANSSVRLFSGVTQLLGESPIRYEELLRHDDILEAVLDVGIQKLNEVRQSVSKAGGLVVVSDIEHAQQVSEILLRKGESVEVVNNQTPQARQRINHFRNSQTRWIVAVSMVSEGTDIPRLMVCCYLSRIRTELHYRQVLGRILRKTGQIDVEAWLYVIAEPTLRKFSARIADDLPHDRATLQTKKIDKRQHQAIESEHGKEGTPSEDGDAAVDPIAISRALLWDGASENDSDATIRTLSFSKYYRQYLLSLA
jgi:superfamily II DNA or RNA helicase